MSKPSQPYQPFLLRFLHGLTGLCLILAVLTAFWTYNTYDGRWVKLPLPDYKAIEGIHGTFGLYTLLIFPAFVRYAFQRGQHRLLQADDLKKLAQLQPPARWYMLNRFTNTLALVALTFALFSGKMMDSTWLPKGELNHTWYYLHLIAWVIVVISIALHLLMNARVGGSPLLRSMWNTHIRTKDSPKRWPQQVTTWWHAAKAMSWIKRFQIVKSLSRLELAIWSILIAAWTISLVKEFS